MENSINVLTDTTALLLTEYEQNGYLSIPKAYGGEKVRQIIDVLTTAKVFDYNEPDPVYNLLTAFPIIGNLIVTAPLQGIVEKLLGEQAFAVRAMIIDKTKDNNWILDWHQDRRVAVKESIETAGFTNWSSQYAVHHVCASLEVLKNFLIARISLDPMSKENGAIFIVPNTHREGIYEHEEILSKVKKIGPLLYEMKAGDMMIMSPLLIHNSPRSTTSVSRRILSIEFSACPLPNQLTFLT